MILIKVINNVNFVGYKSVLIGIYDLFYVIGFY